MYLTETHIIKPSHSSYKRIDQLCFYSKNLYNSTLYLIKTHFESTGTWLRYNQLDKLMQSNENYSLLPAATSQQILMVIDKNLKSYFALLRLWKKNKTKLKGCPEFPRYKDKIKGRNFLFFTNQQLRFKNDYIILPKKCELKPILNNHLKVHQVRIIPCLDYYKIEVVYEKECKVNNSKEKYASIDLGLNNLATVASSNPFIINGKPLKSINQYYNKKYAEIKSKLEKNHGKKTSKKIRSLTNKRNFKINDYLHKASRVIINQLVKENVTNLVIGINKEWKQNISLGSKTNQNFVQIPHSKFIQMIEYKAALEGISVVVREESYTSKCSALDLESIEKHEVYVGKRTKRGMFVSKEKRIINADLNGALNILRKESANKGLEMIQTLSSRGQVVWPKKLKLF